jgi:hypothetical protein
VDGLLLLLLLDERSLGGKSRLLVRVRASWVEVGSGRGRRGDVGLLTGGRNVLALSDVD